MTDARIKAIAPWFGGKRTLAPRIAEELGRPTSFVDLMCGSCAVLLAMKPAAHETVNDLHGDLTNLAWVLQEDNQADRLYGRLQRLLFAEEVVTESWRRTSVPIAAGSRMEGQAAVERAYWYFVQSWAGRNGVAGTARSRGPGFSLAVRFTAGGGSPTVRFKSAVESIPAWHDRLRNVVILRRNVFDIAGGSMTCRPCRSTPTRPTWRTLGAATPRRGQRRAMSMSSGMPAWTCWAKQTITPGWPRSCEGTRGLASLCPTTTAAGSVISIRAGRSWTAGRGRCWPRKISAAAEPGTRPRRSC